MKAQEHRAIGDAAAGGARVSLGHGSLHGGLTLGFGDVVALTGDYFLPDSRPAVLDPDGAGPGPEVFASGGLFWLATVPGGQGTVLGSRDEIIGALKVMAADQGIADSRFEPGGEFADYRFSPSAAETDVERRVRDRFLALGASNDDHFVSPGGRGPTTADDRPAARFGSARRAYRQLHEVALDRAHRLGRDGGDLGEAMAREAAAQHYLTDAFAAGHLRTPVAAIREFWQRRYPAFWESLRRKVAGDTARALKDLAWPFKLVSDRTLYHRALVAAELRTKGYPRISFGDLLAKVFHDWDNIHGLEVEGGGWVFGDGCLDQGITKDLALSAARAGIDEVEVAFRLGASGSSRPGESLYRAVRQATGASDDAYAAEGWIARPSEDNPPQNWQAADFDALWVSPIVGSTGPTVGQAVAEALEAGEELPRRLDCLGRGFGSALSVSGLPRLERWLGRQACQAYHRGFLDGLVQDPKATVQAVIHGAEDAGDGRPAATVVTSRNCETGLFEHL
ncbi:MAG: hypothetical protein M3179_09090 [Actinomycetota bacterium]|nr:hypothetical protein [Actinomycetota bacterium]